MHHLRLWFTEDSTVELSKTEFASPLLSGKRVCSRTNNHTAIGMTGSFRWSSAVKAMCLLFAQHRLPLTSGEHTTNQILFSGGRGSLAASLDAALAKQPTWLLDVFGGDAQGNSLLRRLVSRDNPELKRPGPVTVFLKSNLLNSITVSLYLNGPELKEEHEIKRLIHRLREEGPQSARACSETHYTNLSTITLTHDTSSSPIRPYLNSYHWQARLVGDLISEAGKVLVGNGQPLEERNISGLTALRKNRLLQRYVQRRVWDVFAPLCKNAPLDPAAAVIMLKDFVQQRGRPLAFGTGTGSFGPLAIFSYLRSVFGIPIEIHYNFANTQALVAHIASKGEASHLDGCNFSAACASRFIGKHGTKAFSPVMVLPHTSHQVVSRKPVHHLKQLKETRNIYITDALSTSHLFMDEMVGDPMKLSNSTSVPQELAPALLGEEEESSAILWFPHYHLNVLFNNLYATDILPVNNGSDLNFLFLHKELVDNRRLGQALSSLCQASWTALATNRSVLEMTLRPVLEAPRFMQFFKESCGLSNFRYSEIFLGSPTDH
jgi:hypothetical protein